MNIFRFFNFALRCAVPEMFVVSLLSLFCAS